MKLKNAKNLEQELKNFGYDDVVEMAMRIENKILDEVCDEDNENMQFTIPYDKNCHTAGVDKDGNLNNPPNSFNLHDTILELLLDELGIEDEFE